MKATVSLSCVWLLTGTATLFADSRAYVLSSNDTPGSLTPVSISKSTVGPAEFVPAGGKMIVTAPVTGQLWEATNSSNINILNPADGSVLATMPLSSGVYELAFDPAGAFAYATLGNGDLIQISVAQRAITQTAPDFGGIHLQVSTDGTKLFTTFNQTAFQLDTRSLTVLNRATFSGGFDFKVVGPTLLICDDSGLSYYDTATFRPIRSTVRLPAAERLIDVSPDGARIYTQTITAPQVYLEALDFTTGRLLTARAFPSIDTPNPVLSPDGQHVLLLGDQIQILDANTFATTSTVTPAGGPMVVGFLDNDTLLLLDAAAGAMTVVDQASAQVIDSFPVGAQMVEPALATPNGKSIFVGTAHASNLLQIDTSVNRLANIFFLDAFFAPYALDGNQLYGGQGISSPVLDFNFTTGTASALPRVPSSPACPGGCLIRYGVGGSPPNGTTFWMSFVATYAVGIPHSQGLAIYSTATNTIIEELPLPLCCLAGPIVFSPDSAWAYLAVGPNILVYSTLTLQYVTTFAVPARISSLAIAPAGKYLYALTGTSVISLSAATGAMAHTWTLPDAAQNMALAPDGTALFLTVTNPTSTLDILNTITSKLTRVPVPYPPTSVVAVKN